MTFIKKGNELSTTEYVHPIAFGFHRIIKKTGLRLLIRSIQWIFILNTGKNTNFIEMNDDRKKKNHFIAKFEINSHFTPHRRFSLSLSWSEKKTIYGNIIYAFALEEKYIIVVCR